MGAPLATLPMGVEITFARNVGTFRYGSCDGRVSGSGSGDASDGRRNYLRPERWPVPLRGAAMGAPLATLPMGVERTFSRNVGTFRYGMLR